MTAATDTLLRVTPVIPVITVDDPATGVALARALASGGIAVAELTLRTPSALAVIEAIAREVPGFLIGAGTVRTAAQLRSAIDAGARFAVSPGSTAALLDVGIAAPIPCLPGVATASEVMRAGEAGYTCLKFFPAVAAGGTGALAALAGPFPEVWFCPTGGITAATAADYLRLPNVACVGGSWLTPQRLVRSADWPGVTALAAAARSLSAVS